MIQNLPAPLPDLDAEIAVLARAYRRANGPVMALMQRLGGSVEQRLALLPKGVQAQIERVTLRALDHSLSVAALGRYGPDLGANAAPVMAAISGAAGGAGGLLTSVAELPVTITLILHSIREAARAEGFDPDDPWVRAECLQVFASGSPIAADDGVNTSFIGARLTVTGPALNNLIRTLAPRIASALGQKLAAQAVPVLGALSGAALNTVFLRHYRALAQIRFALLRLSQSHGAGPVLLAFQGATKAAPLTKA